MLRIKKTTTNYDKNNFKEEILQFEDLTEMKKYFHIRYIDDLIKYGYFVIQYRTGGDPRMADSWNGQEEFSLIK